MTNTATVCARIISGQDGETVQGLNSVLDAITSTPGITHLTVWDGADQVLDIYYGEGY